eukprot:gene5170-3718_t
MASDADTEGPTGLPPLRPKRKLQPDRFVQFGHAPSHPDQAPPKQMQQRPGSKNNSRLPHMSPGAPCSLSTSIKFAEIVHNKWNCPAVLPTMLSTKNPARFMINGTRGKNHSWLREDRKKITSSSTHVPQWYEKTAIMSSLAVFCTAESLANLFQLNRAANTTLKSDEVWSVLLHYLQLTPLLKMHRVSNSYYDFFRAQVVTTSAISGLYVYENLRPPSPRYSFSLPTELLISEQNSPGPTASGTTEDGADDLSAQKRFQNVRLMLTPATFGCRTFVLSRAHLLLRRWPPFDQIKVYLGSCRFCLDQKGFIFTFLDELSEPHIMFTTSFVYLESDGTGQLKDAHKLLIRLAPQSGSESSKEYVSYEEQSESPYRRRLKVTQSAHTESSTASTAQKRTNENLWIQFYVAFDVLCSNESVSPLRSSTISSNHNVIYKSSESNRRLPASVELLLFRLLMRLRVPEHLAYWFFIYELYATTIQVEPRVSKFNFFVVSSTLD